MKTNWTKLILCAILIAGASSLLFEAPYCYAVSGFLGFGMGVFCTFEEVEKESEDEGE